MLERRNNLPLQFAFCFLVLLTGCATRGGDGPELDDVRRKANQGDPSAQFQLGLAYDRGHGLPRNPLEAAAWYRKAAEQGLAPAQNSLGSMYQHGEGTPQNNVEAVNWYQKAVDQNWGEAYTNLGYMYDGGFGIAQDKAKAATLYRSGAEKGSVNGMLNLGVSFWKGEGVPKDIVQAHMWLDLARFHTQRSPNMQLKYRIRGALDEVRKVMTADQIAKAQQLTREWNAAHR